MVLYIKHNLEFNQRKINTANNCLYSIFINNYYYSSIHNLFYITNILIYCTFNSFLKDIENNYYLLNKLYLDILINNCLDMLNMD